MIVRIKLRVGPQVAANRDLDSKLATALATFLTPAAVLCFVVALWRLLADLNVTTAFVITTGLLSHWQVWLALGIGVQAASVYLDRYGRRGEEQA
jgi:hypothetical protein